jgi:hypothetical protein
MRLDNTDENVCIAREGVVKLLGDFRLAVVLEQLIYWSRKTRDYDRFLQEEIILISESGDKSNVGKRHGWIYKSAKELSEELMGIGAPSTIAKDLVELENRGFIESRNNPKYKWDHTKQYRPNYIKIQAELLKLGYIHDKIGISKKMITEYRPISIRDKSNNNSDKTIPETTTETANKDSKDSQPAAGPKSKPRTDPHSLMVSALQKTIKMDMKIGSNAGRIVRASKQLREAGYTHEDILAYKDNWKKDWRYKRDKSPPALTTLLSEIEKKESWEDEIERNRKIAQAAWDAAK